MLTTAATIGLAGGQALIQACAPAAPTTPPAQSAQSSQAAAPPAASPTALPTTVPAPAIVAASSPQPSPAAAAAAPAQAAPAAPQVRGVFTFATDQQTQTLDPVFINRESARALQLLINETLITLDDNTQNPKYVPNLAKSWSTSQDGKTWTFKLQENVKFTDGTPLDAAAVKYSFERLMDPKTVATQGIARTKILDRVDAVDSTTVNFVTKQPYSEFLLALVDSGTAIVSPTAAQKGAVADYGKMPVGSGPYKFAEWQGADTAIAVPNPNYWGPKKARLERIVLKQVPEAGAIVAGLQAGEIDYTNSIPPALFSNLQGNPKLKVSAVSTTATHIMGVLTTKKPFDDVRVRQAMMYAVDRDTICKTIMRGLAVPQTSPLWPGNQFRVEEPPYNFDQARAKDLLNQAGYGSGFKCAILYSNFTPSAELCQAYGEYLGQVGIDIDLQQRDDAVWSQLVRAHDDARDLFLQAKSGIGTDFNLNRLYSGQLIDEDNRGRWTNPRIEELLPKGRESFDDAERAKIYTEIQKIAWDNVPELFGWHPQTILAMGANVEGLVYQPWPVTLLGGVSKSS
jgi:ABC-type transport system substrate-binding protein